MLAAIRLVPRRGLAVVRMDGSTVIPVSEREELPAPIARRIPAIRTKHLRKRRSRRRACEVDAAKGFPV